MRRLVQLKSATAVLSTKESAPQHEVIAVPPLRCDRFLVRLECLEHLEHYRPPQPRMLAIDEHSSWICCEAATAVLVVRNPASGSDARRLGALLRVRMTHRSAHALLARRHAGTRVESV